MRSTFYKNPLIFALIFYFFMPLCYGQPVSFDQKTALIDSLLLRGNCGEIIRVLNQNNLAAESVSQSKLPHLYNILSRCQLEHKKLQAAKKSAERVIELLNEKDHETIIQLAMGYDNLGSYFLEKVDYPMALKSYRKALELRKSQTPINSIETMRSHLNLSYTYSYKHDFIKAQSHLDTTRNILGRLNEYPKDLIGKYFEIEGHILNKKEEYETAIVSYNKAIKEYSAVPGFRKTKIASIQGNIGFAYYHLWDYDKALRYIKKSLDIYLEEIGEDIFEVSNGYSYLARIYGRRGEYEKALEYNKKTIAINSRVYGEKDYRVGLANAITGVVYSYMDDYENQLYYFEKALGNFIENFGEEHKWVITTYENIGRVHYRLGAYETSLEYYKKAISIARKTLKENKTTEAHLYLNAADAYAAMNLNEEAEQLFDKALKIQLETFGEKHREVAQNYIAQGNFQTKLGNYQSALDKYELVLSLYEPEITATLEEEFVQEEFNLLYKLIEAIEGKAQCLLQRYFELGKLEDLKASNKAFENSNRISEKMRRVTTSTSDRIELIAYNQTSPKGATRTRVLLYRETGDRAHLEKAFNYSEKNRAGVLQELSLRSNSKNTEGAISPLLALESNLKRNKTKYLSKIKNEKNKNEKIDSVQLLFYEDELFSINRRYDSVLNRMEIDYPKYFAMEYSNEMISIADIQAELDTNTTILEYFIADKVLFAFIISKSNFEVSELKLFPIVENIDEFKNSIENKNVSTFKKSGHELYTNLIKPLQERLTGTKLIVIPDGSLWHLNFDLLLTRNDISNNPKNLSYFFRDYAISYGNSVNFLLKVSRKAPSPNTDCLAFSFSDSLNTEINSSMNFATLRNTKEDLPGSRREIMEISNLVNGEYFYGSDANEATFKARAGNFGILHLALHGDVDHKNPENSRLYFTNNKDTLEDNFLYGHELFNMQLPSELTVLSSCNSGMGKIKPGEGIMSLGNAFQYAGTKSLLMTHWEVSDEVTPEIIKLFYTNLKAGMDKATALQQAKLNYLKNADSFRTHPFYWGSFYLVGDSSSITFARGSDYLWYAAGVVIFLIVIVLFVRLHSSKH